jgi:hypothetical protein
VAVAPDGHVVLQMHDLLGVVLGHVHRDTGEFRTRTDRRAARSVAGTRA